MHRQDIYFVNLLFVNADYQVNDSPKGDDLLFTNYCVFSSKQIRVAIRHSSNLHHRRHQLLGFILFALITLEETIRQG